jgi:alpha-glucoside transport system substrate-binding protein
VEVAHEALLLRWPRLGNWVEEQREDIWVRDRLHAAAEEWEEQGRDVGFLLSAGRLDLFDSWAASSDLRLNPADQEFLEASLAERERRTAADAARAAHEEELEHRATNRLRALVAVFATAAVVAVTLSLIVFRQQQSAEEQQAIASGRELAAASIGALRADPELSLLLAIEAARTTPDRGYVVEEAMDALHWALQESQIPYPQIEAPIAVRASPDRPRGVFLLAPDQLARHASDNVGRRLSEEECRTYLHRPSCPDGQVAPGRPLDVYTATGRADVEQLAGGSLEGAEIRVVTGTPSEVDALVAGFVDDAGIEVEWVVGAGGGDLRAGIVEDKRPDVAIVARPGLIGELAKQGHLIEMSGLLGSDEIVAELDPYLAELATTGDRRYGIPWAVSVSSLIWYPAAEFEEAGYRIPHTWSQLIALSEQMVADGLTPWCFGVAAGHDSGAIATDWIEDILLRSSGPATYDGLVRGAVGFDSTVVREAFQRLHEVAFGDGFVPGGATSIIYTPERLAAWPMFTDPPRCWLHRAGTESRADWPVGRSTELGAFPFPTVDLDYTEAITGRVYMIVVLRDRPEVRRFVEFLLSPDSAAALASSPPRIGLLPARPVDSSSYRDETGRELDVMLRTALQLGMFRAGASDLMPPEVGSVSFPQGVLTYLTWGETSLETVLVDIEASWP